jgi:hypothetical protein
MIQQDGDIVALMKICAHASNNNCFKQAQQASGKLTPQRLKMHLRLALESKLPARLREAPLRSKPISLATRFKAFRHSGNKTMSVSLTGATGQALRRSYDCP